MIFLYAATVAVLATMRSSQLSRKEEKAISLLTKGVKMEQKMILSADDDADDDADVVDDPGSSEGDESNDRNEDDIVDPV